MVKKKLGLNVIFTIFLLVGLLGTADQLYQLNKINPLNQMIAHGELVKDADYPYLNNFSIAYSEAQKNDYKHAIRAYGKLLENAQAFMASMAVAGFISHFLIWPILRITIA